MFVCKLHMKNLSNQYEFNTLEINLFETGVNCFMSQNVISERFSTALNEEM